MRALRFGLSLAMSAILALGGCAADSGNDGLALAPTQTDILTREFDQQLNYMLTAMIASTEIGPDGKVFFNRPLGDQRFLEPNSGRYWQISGDGHEAFSSRSLWDRKLNVSGRKAWTEPLHYNSDQFQSEPLRVGERTVRLPGSEVEWQFVVARPREGLD